MSQEEREYWNQRYQEEGWRTEPAAFVVEAASYLPPGSRILDVAGGTGRNAIWLAGRGHDVTIADVSEIGLGLARQAADEAGVEVGTEHLDFDVDPLPEGPWDVLLDFHFIDRSLFPVFMDRLRPGGYLIFCRATVKNLEKHDRPPSPYLLQEGEGWDLLTGWELVIAREGWSVEDRHEFEALAKKPE
jgi:tellurite methyltransferase